MRAGTCRKEKEGHHFLATKVLEQMPEVLSAANSSEQTMKELHDNSWIAVLLHSDNLESVRSCSPLCTEYSKGLSSALLTAANNGKHDALPLLFDVFRCQYAT